MSKDVLQTDRHGIPQGWLSSEAAAALLVSRDYAWTDGPMVASFRGGRSNSGETSLIEVPAVVAVTLPAQRPFAGFTPFLGARNDKLFLRDKHICGYCGERHSDDMLSRDHIQPRSRGGEDIWMNVITSCKRCNSHKSNRTPEEAGMPLLFMPYQPNYFEDLLLARGHKRILADQMKFIEMGLTDRDRMGHLFPH